MKHRNSYFAISPELGQELERLGHLLGGQVYAIVWAESKDSNIRVLTPEGYRALNRAISEGITSYDGAFDGE
jgi:hypothetical protein